MKAFKNFLRIFSILVVLLAGVLVFCYVGREVDLLTVRYTIETDKFSKGYAYKLVSLSDYHNHGLKYRNETLEEAIKAENPDSVMMTGDMVDSHSTKEHLEELDAFVGWMRKEDYPVYFVSGNHEEDAPSDIRDQAYEIYAKHDVKMLSDTQNGITLEESDGVLLRLFGFRDPGLGDKNETGLEVGSNIYTQAKGMELNQSDFNLLLSHRPSFFEAAKKKGFDLTLSGHTHAGQVNLFGYPLLSMPWTKYEQGDFLEDGKRLIISNGLGESYQFPFRYHSPYTLLSVTIVGTKE